MTQPWISTLWMHSDSDILAMSDEQAEALLGAMLDRASELLVREFEDRHEG